METLHVTDLDGTFLSSAGWPSSYTIETVNQLIDDRELQLTYATARSFLSASTVTARCRFRLPAIVYGGAFLVDPVGGEFVHSNFLDAGVVDDVIGLCHAHGLPPLVYRIENGRDLVSWVEGEESKGVMEYLMERSGDRRFSPVSGWTALSARHPFYISVIGDSGPVQDLAQVVAAMAGGHLTVTVQKDTYHPHQTWLEVTAKEANKASAVDRLRELLDPREIICFGDNLNDLPMFAVAHRSLAVGNAVDEVKRVADEILLSNDEDGVARWLAARSTVE